MDCTKAAEAGKERGGAGDGAGDLGAHTFGEGEAAACPGAADHIAGKNEGPAQKTRCVGHVARSDFAANDGAGDDFSSIDDRRNDDDVESVYCAKFREQLHVARLLMPETKI